MAGNLDLENMGGAVGAGSLVTVLVCFTDMQGRPIGERVPARTPISSKWT